MVRNTYYVIYRSKFNGKKDPNKVWEKLILFNPSNGKILEKFVEAGKLPETILATVAGQAYEAFFTEDGYILAMTTTSE